MAGMTSTPTTTKLGPDPAFLNNLLRRLAEIVREHEGLLHHDGVAATLRYRR